MFGLPGSRDSFLSSVREVRPSRELQTSPTLKDHPQLSNKMFLTHQSHLALPPFLAFTLRRQTPTHLFRFPSLVFSVLSVNKFWVFSGQQDEGISLRACSEKEMLSLIANPHDSTQLTDYRTQGTASF